jgi:hypothetical protein
MLEIPAFDIVKLLKPLVITSDFSYRLNFPSTMMRSLEDNNITYCYMPSEVLNLTSPSSASIVVLFLKVRPWVTGTYQHYTIL